MRVEKGREAWEGILFADKRLAVTGGRSGSVKPQLPSVL